MKSALLFVISSFVVAAPLLHTVEDSGGTDLPPILAEGTQTRSLFDVLVKVGKGGAPSESIYPFSNLMDLVKGKTGAEADSPFRAILIPFSRALERQYASYKFPRALMGVDTYPVQDQKNLGLFMKDRLFVGFSKTPKVLEVISFNELASRFEFQLVTNYGDGLKPNVVYASRALCITCHKNHGPMFAKGPWSETNGNKPVADQIARFQMGRDLYEGVKIRPGTNDIAHNFDLSTDAANLLMPLNEVWTKWCGDGENGNRCRARLFQMGLSWSLISHVDESSPRYQELVKLLKTQFENQKLVGFTLPNFDLNNRDPYVRSGGGGSSTDADSVSETDVAETDGNGAQRLGRLIKQFDLPDYLEPAKDVCHVGPTDSFGYPMDWDDPTVSGLFLIYSLHRFFSPMDFELLKSSGDTVSILDAVDGLVESEVLGAKPIMRADLINAILKQLNVPRVAAGELSTLGPPVVNSDGSEVHEVLGKDPRVAPFWNSCRECHLQYPVDFSQAKSDEDIFKVISDKRVARKMFIMLDWDNNPPSPGPMPPKASGQYKDLAGNEAEAKRGGFKSDRQKMLDILQSFLNQ